MRWVSIEYGLMVNARIATQEHSKNEFYDSSIASSPQKCKETPNIEGSN